MNNNITKESTNYAERIIKLENMLQSKKVSNNWKSKIEEEIKSLWVTVSKKQLTFFVQETISEMRDNQ